MTPDMYLRKLPSKDLIYYPGFYLHGKKTTAKQDLAGTYQLSSLGVHFQSIMQGIRHAVSNDLFIYFNL